jgi:hypothetical protein
MFSLLAAADRWWTMFGDPWLWMTGGAVLLGFGVALGWAALRCPRRITVERARRLFHLQRERMEFRFIGLATQAFRPRGLELVDCDFEDDVLFARDKHNGRLRAYVAVTIHFQAVEGGPLEDNPNVDNLKAGSAEFRLAGSEWNTDGRVVFNLNPVEAIQHYRQELEMVE